MPLFKLEFKVTTQGMEFHDVIMVPAKDKKQAKSIFQRLTSTATGVKGQIGPYPSLYDMSQSKIEVYNVVDMPWNPEAKIKKKKE